MKHLPGCRGVGDAPCRFGAGGNPARVSGFGLRCARCRRRWLRARAVADMLELSGLAVADAECQPAGDEQQPARAEGDVDADGTVWFWDDGDAAAQ